MRLSGEFHLVLGAIAGNRVLEQMVRQLVTRTSLILGLFGAAGTDVCRSDEHGQLLAAIRRRDPGAAEALMLEHLARIEAGLDLSHGHGRRNQPDRALLARARSGRLAGHAAGGTA